MKDIFKIIFILTLFIMLQSCAGSNSRMNAINDIETKNVWIDRLTEIEKFFDLYNQTEFMPYTLFYLNEIQRHADLQNKDSSSISIETYLYGSSVWTLSIDKVLQQEWDRLDGTGRKIDWGLQNWPQKGITHLGLFDKKTSNFTVVFELVNNQNKVIGKESLQATGYWEINESGRPIINLSAPYINALYFHNIRNQDITSNITIKASYLNDTQGTASQLNILPISKAEIDVFNTYKYSKGQLMGFANATSDATELDLPDNIWGDPVISIGDRAFTAKQLTRVAIPEGVESICQSAFSSNLLSGVSLPNSLKIIGDGAFAVNPVLRHITIPANVTTIGNEAFMFTRLTELQIPDSVTSIGDRAFYNGLLSNISLPNSVTNIGRDAFYNRRSETTTYSVTIGSNVSITSPFRIYNGENSAVFDFKGFYENNLKRAGRYTRKETGEWTYTN